MAERKATPLTVRFARFTDEERLAMIVIEDRALHAFREAGIERTRQDIEMDIAAVHHHTPLRLRELAEADDFHFNHDLFGIYRHLNRRTGELENHFRPRFAQRRTEASHACTAGIRVTHDGDRVSRIERSMQPDERASVRGYHFEILGPVVYMELAPITVTMLPAQARELAADLLAGADAADAAAQPQEVARVS